MKQISFSSIALKATVVHTVTYFVIGVIFYFLLDYSTKYADPTVARLMRQTNDPLFVAASFFQIVRGFLFGITFYALREIIFSHNRGWLTLWLVLVIVGILSPFGASPSSIEGMVYTILPTWFHLMALPEVLAQAGLLAFVTHFWVYHPEKKWLNWLLGILFVAIILVSFLGILSTLIILPTAG
jgi:hypothetical protein